MGNSGITHLHHLFENNQFLSFHTIVQKYGVGTDQFLQYHQLKAAIQCKVDKSNSLKPSNTTEQILKIADQPQKVISKLYKVIASSSSSITLPTAKWENDLVFSPTPDFWTNICKNIFSMTSNTNLQLIQYKTLHRYHITQSKLFRMGTVNTDICPHCTLGSIDTYLHATWNCQSFLDRSHEDTLHHLGLWNPTFPQSLSSRRHHLYPHSTENETPSTCLSNYR